MNKLNSKRHFWLYAKGLYEEGDVINDLQKLISEYSYYENADKSMIADFLSDIVQNEIIIKNKPAYCFSKFLESLQPSQRIYIGYRCKEKNWDYHIAVIYACLNFMRFQDKEVFGDLGKPDDNILKLSKNAKIKIEEGFFN